MFDSRNSQLRELNLRLTVKYSHLQTWNAYLPDSPVPVREQLRNRHRPIIQTSSYEIRHFNDPILRNLNRHPRHTPNNAMDTQTDFVFKMIHYIILDCRHLDSHLRINTAPSYSGGGIHPIRRVDILLYKHDDPYRTLLVEIQ